MKKTAKTLLSVLLAAVLAVSMLSIGALAVSADGEGTDITAGFTLYAIEHTDEYNDTDLGAVSVIYNSSDTEAMALVDAALNVSTVEGFKYQSGEGHAVINIDGKDYTISHYVNGGGWYRFNVEEPGAVIENGKSYQVSLSVYDKDNNLVAYTSSGSVTSQTATTATPDDDEDEGGETTTVVTTTKAPATQPAVTTGNAEKEESSSTVATPIIIAIVVVAVVVIAAVVIFLLTKKKK